MTQIMLDSLQPDDFDYDELLQRHTTTINQIEGLLGIGRVEGSGSQSQMSSQGSWGEGEHTPPETNGEGEGEGDGVFGDLLSPVANFNAFNRSGMAGATGE